MPEQVRYHAIVDTNLNAIIVVDSLGKVVDWNEAATQIFGYERHEMLGDSVSRLVPEHLKETHNYGFRNAMRAGHSILSNRVLEFEALHKDGSIIPIEL